MVVSRGASDLETLREALHRNYLTNRNHHGRRSSIFVFGISPVPVLVPAGPRIPPGFLGLQKKKPETKGF